MLRGFTRQHAGKLLLIAQEIYFITQGVISVKKSIVFTIIALLLILLSACSPEKNNQETNGSAEDVKTDIQVINVTDSNGNELTFAKSPQRVIVLGSYAAEMFKGLGIENVVVGVDEYTKEKVKWPDYIANVPSVGSNKTPDIEMIASLNADLVIATFLSKDSEDKLKAAGIPVLWNYGFKTEIIPQEFTTLGKLFNQQERAEEWNNFIKQHWENVKNLTKDISTENRPLVYWESGMGPYKTFSAGSGADPLINMAGGINIAGKEPVPNPEVSPEWIVEKNPDIIVKYVNADLLGWDGMNETGLKELRDEIMNRPGFNHIDAVKNGKVYLIASNITSSPRGVVGLNYIAEWFYPELDQILDSEAIHKEMLKKFYDEEYRGTWLYK